MARQVLTLPDVPASLLTQAAAAATYLPLTGGTLTGDLTRNGADLSNRLIKWQTNGADRWRMGIIDAQAEGAPDTGGDFTFQYVWNDGTAFDLYRIDRNVGALVFNAQNAAVVFEANGTTYPLIVRSRGDTQPALQVQYNGRLEWGTGGAATDTYLNRGGVGALQVGATLFPGNASTNDLGTTASRWRKLWAAAGEFTTVPTVGGVALPTSAGVAALYLPLAGGSLSGNLGVGVAPAPWASRVGVQIGNAGALGGDPTGTTFTLASNSYYDGANKAIVTGASVLASLSSGALSIFTAPSVAAGATQTFTNRLAIASAGDLDVNGTRLTLGNTGAASGSGGNVMLRDDTGANRWIMGIPGSAASKDWFLYDLAKGTRMQVNGTTGTVALTPDAGQPCIITPNGSTALVFGYGHLRSVGAMPFIDGQAGGYLMLGAGSGGTGNSASVAPATDNATSMGWSDRRWTQVCAVAGSINTSHVSMKRDFAPLDPAACATAVAETDWLSFTYNPPVAPERGEDMDDKAWDEQRAQYQKMLLESASSRRSKGYVLGSEAYQTSALFGQSDRKSGQATADLAVVACALQDALKRIAQLEAAR